MSDELQVKCRKCNIGGKENQFRNIHSRGYLYFECSSCAREIGRAYYACNKSKLTEVKRLYRKSNKYKVDASIRKCRYELEEKEFNILKNEQKNSCAICNKEFEDGRYKGPCVDHCHVTGKVRGLLCRGCNTFIGAYEKRMNLLPKIQRYINR